MTGLRRARLCGALHSHPMRHDLPFKPGQPAEHVAVRDGYDRWAAIYDDEANPLILLEDQHLPPLLGDVRGLALADLGCGTGRHALRWAAAGAEVTAVDFSDGMLAAARRKAEQAGLALRFVVHDLTARLPLADASFDCALCCLVLDHIADLAEFLREMGRVARPAGRMIISTVHPAMLLRGIHAHFRDPATGVDVCPASLPYEISDYVMAAVRAGLRIVHLSEHAVRADLAARSRRARKYAGWPLLLLMELAR